MRQRIDICQYVNMSGYCVNMSWDSDMLWYANMSWDCVNMSICREIPTYQHIYILWWNHWTVCRNGFYQWIPFHQSKLMRNRSELLTEWRGSQISNADFVALGTRGDTRSHYPHWLYASNRPYPNPPLRTTHTSTPQTLPTNCQQLTPLALTENRVLDCQNGSWDRGNRG